MRGSAVRGHALLPLVCVLWLTAGGPLAFAAAPQGLRLRDAVLVALSRQPAVLLGQQQVEAARGSYLSQSGLFDLHLSAALNQRGDIQPLTAQQSAANCGTPKITTYTTIHQLGVDQQVRFGTLISPSLQFTRIAANCVNPPYGQARFVLAVVQPLLRGRGAVTVAARETAARLDVSAAEAQQRQTLAQAIYDTASAYFAWVAATEAAAMWRDAEERAGVLLSEQRKLVHARERAAADLQALLGNLADMRASRLGAEALVLEARQSLGLVIGLSWEEIAALPPPADALPQPVLGDERSDAEWIRALTGQALGRRGDRLAAQAAVRSAEVLRIAAQRDLEPQLDLEVDLGYAGLSAGSGAGPFLTPLWERVSGLNFYAGLNFQYPVQNRAAQGLRWQRQAVQRQAVVALTDAERRIGVAIAQVVAALRVTALQLDSAAAAVRSYRQAVDSEKRRLRAGLSTVFDVILREDRLTAAALQVLQARANLASAGARLRLESGTLVQFHGTTIEPNVDDLLWAREPANGRAPSPDVVGH